MIGNGVGWGWYFQFRSANSVFGNNSQPFLETTSFLYPPPHLPLGLLRLFIHVFFPLSLQRLPRSAPRVSRPRWLPLADTKCAPNLISLPFLHLRSHCCSVNSSPALSFSFCFPNLPTDVDLGLRLVVRGRWATPFPSFSRLIQHSINRYLLSIFYVADAGLGDAKQSESRWTRTLLLGPS